MTPNNHQNSQQSDDFEILCPEKREYTQPDSQAGDELSQTIKELVNDHMRRYWEASSNDSVTQMYSQEQITISKFERFIDDYAERLAVKRADDAVIRELDSKMNTILDMISTFIRGSWPNGDVLRASEVKKPIDYDPLVRQIRDFARENNEHGIRLGRVITAADKVLATLTKETEHHE